ncbi:MAG: transcription-repair coupling factor [Proteobacteria bacterium]|nr:transcription-repair coupling factor [Pseudomonadota bacterium]
MAHPLPASPPAAADSAPALNLLHPPLPAEAGACVRWAQLSGSSYGLALCEVARSHSGPLLVITEDTLHANRLEQEVLFYTGTHAGLPVLTFPDWETLPYDTFSPHQDIISQRLTALYHLPALERGVLIVPVETLLHRIAPREYVQAHSLLLETGARIDLGAMRARLEASGYRCVSQVMEHGEFAVRGSLMDLFPMGSELPYRIDLFDDNIDSLRTFDVETQRSLVTAPSIRLLPAREFPLNEEAIARFRRNFREQFEGDPQQSPLYRDVSKGLAPPGIEYYLPLFFSHTDTLLDYLPPASLVLTTAGVEQAAHAFWHSACERHEQRRHDRERPLLAPESIFVQPDALFAGLHAFPQVQLQHAPNPAASNFATGVPPELTLDGRAAQPAARLLEFLSAFSGRVLLAAETSGRRETLIDLLKQAGLRPALFADWPDFLAGAAPLGITVAPLEHGLLLPEARIAVIAETQLFGEQVLQRRRRKARTRDAEGLVRNLAELSLGSPVVHEDHGVGRYRGLQILDVGGLQTEFLTLEYAGGDKLYVPVASLHLISRYTGAAPEQAPWHKLGGEQWARAKRKAAERARDVAAELLEIHARRAAREGHAFTLDEHDYLAFAAAFPFEETPDQHDAIESVLADMRGGKPMDRLVCGDVGFGKTEVAMRAAFVAVQGGRQVAVLVPTTLLAQQHYQNFKDRFADWPVRIETISRFRSKKEQDAVIEGLADGAIDIVIGTHKLLQEGIAFKRLGLVILDEEHRFGVRQKERFKQLRAEVDVLTLTATPIPRTLSLSLAGLRDLSIIATPPARRIAVKTFVREWDKALIHEAVLREIKRGGQVYFLHNDVDTIEKMARDLAALVPDASVRVAHGQMRERELEQVMLDFYHQRFNLLVCSTIIESGIDVPSANTIIINRADKFGLAQLYQLRGRIGRSHHSAYAYLIIPERNAISADANKRLEAIESIQELGAGFTLATHDLEIRGAGELLGEDQSGQMQEIGFTLYAELLERAVASLKAGREPELDRPLDHGAEIDLRLPALIPDDYLPDVHARLMLYKRIASAATDDELRELQVEMIDRFGLLPEAAKNLFTLTGLKLKAQPRGIRKIEAGEGGARVIFNDHPAVDPGKIIALIQREPKVYKLDGQNKLRMIKPLSDATARIHAIEQLLQTLS